MEATFHDLLIDTIQVFKDESDVYTVGKINELEQQVIEEVTIKKRDVKELIKGELFSSLYGINFNFKQ